MIGVINKQLPPIFQLRIEDDELRLYMTAESDITTVSGNKTKRMRRYKTLCKKDDVKVYLGGMQSVLDMFYLMSKVDNGKA